MSNAMNYDQGLLRELADNPEPRCPCVLLLDVSGSMNDAYDGYRAIDQLNNSIGSMKTIIENDTIASLRVDMAVITFGGDGAQVIQPFDSIHEFRPPQLTANGGTPFGAALRKAMEMIEGRRAEYKAANLPRPYRPWLVVFTDGAPNDPGWEDAVKAAHQAEDNRRFVYFVFGVQPISPNTLSQISPKKKPLMLLENHAAFRSTFEWLGQAMSVVSNSTPPTDGSDNANVQIAAPQQGIQYFTIGTN